VKLTAEYNVRERGRVNEVINSGLLYGAVAGALVTTLAWLFTERIAGWYNVRAELLPAFHLLIRIVGVSWGAGLFFNILSAGIEGLQRFDVTSRIWIGSTAGRAVLTLMVLWLGYGLEAMGWVMLATQSTAYLATYVAWRGLFPEFHFSWAAVTRRMLGQQISYGWKVIPSIISARAVGSVLPTQISKLISVTSVSYYSLSMKLIEYAADAVGRVGLVSGPQATQLMAEGRRHELALLAENGNRYSLTVWMLPASFLLVYGWEFYRWWMGREVADVCSRLLPPLLLAHTASVSQFISNAILMGLDRFGRYSWSLLMEAGVTLAGMAYILPRWGLEGGMWWLAALMVANRCLHLLYLTLRELEVGVWEYVGAIYPAPLGTGLAAAAASWGLKQTVWPADSLWSLAGAGLSHLAIFGALAVAFCLRPEHRRKLWAARYTLGRFQR
jgi:O-antigen/teichoic acid export membrane protein